MGIHMARWRSIAVVAIGLLGWGTLVLAGGACDRSNSNRQASAREAERSASASNEASSNSEGTETTSEPSAEGSGAMESLPGDREPGSRQPEVVGPKAPALFFVAGLKGYLEPCGCSADVLLGGAERVAGYVRAARKLYPSTTMLDAGDTFFREAELEEHRIPQAKAQTKVVSELVKALDIEVTVPGERDFALGADWYRERLEAAEMEPIASNLTMQGESLPSTKTLELGDWTLGIVGAVQPDLYEGIEAVETSDPVPAVGDALDALPGDVDATVLLLHGTLKTAKDLLDARTQLDFAVVGHKPRETDQVDRTGKGHTLEAYTQGRYVGILKFHNRGGSRPFEDARTGSEAELKKIDNQIAHVEESIDKLTPAPPGETPPILSRLRERLDDLEQRRERIKHAELEISETQKSFHYRPVPMKPGYPIDRSIQKKRNAFNAKLKELNAQADRDIPEVPEGEATYVGTNQCAQCHVEAHEFWKGTHHGGAVATLQKRNKLYDQQCVGCHVVGYEKPGGSVLGKLKYDATVNGSTITKDLRNVGCESCHGPGSKHMAAPVGSDGRPQHIQDGTGQKVCMECHVPEHSPSFDYETYVRQITGEGHPLDEAESGK